MFSRSRSIIEIDDDDDGVFEFKSGKPRNIVFCIDVSAEMNEELGPSANTGQAQSSLYQSSRLETVQRLVKRYVDMNKMIGNRSDKYGIMLLKDEATWWYNCHSDRKRFHSEIDFLDSQVTKYHEKFNTASIFREIEVNINLDDEGYFTQAILFYSRTDVRPTHRKRKDFEKVRDSPNFTLDVIYMHRQSLDNVQSVYDELELLDSPVNSGWYYEAGTLKGKDKLAKALSELLANPLQRVDQDRSEMQTVIAHTSLLG